MAKRTLPETKPKTDEERRLTDLRNAQAAGDGLSQAEDGTYSLNLVADTPLGITGAALDFTQGAHVADVSSSDASDLASAITLVNECKTRINALISSLETAKIKASS